jgi:hypothetical protein
MAKSAEVISHWHHSAEEFSTSAIEFYQAVRTELQAAQAPVRFDEVEWHEGGLLSAKRSYLRVEYNRFTFDICAAPFGTSFFFSWWLAKRPPDLAMLFGCLGLIALPLFLWIFVAAAGIVKGFFFFVIALGVGAFALSNMAGSGGIAVEDAILAIPVVGPLYHRFFMPVTYFSVDSRIMFEEAVHGTVLKIVEGLLAAKGARALSPEQARAHSRDPLK